MSSSMPIPPANGCPVDQRRSGARRRSTGGTTSRVRAGLVLLTLVLGALLGPGAALAGATQPQAIAAPAGTLDGRSRLTVDMPGDEEAPGSVTVTVGGAQQAAQ